MICLLHTELPRPSYRKMLRLPRLAHVPVAVARRRERDLGGALSLAQLQGHSPLGYFPPLSRRDVNPTPLDKLDQWSLSHAAGYLSWWEVVILRRLLPPSRTVQLLWSNWTYQR